MYDLGRRYVSAEHDIRDCSFHVAAKLHNTSALRIVHKKESLQRGRVSGGQACADILRECQTKERASKNEEQFGTPLLLLGVNH